MGEGRRNEVGQLGCTSVKEVGENGQIGQADPTKSGFNGSFLRGRPSSNLKSCI